ncbi:MAG TPA: organomercurial lyase [Blastocatellia bacterium]|nr:organomercurial lyase [Blastocatellia bacterium]
MTAGQEKADFDKEVRRVVYDFTMREGAPPTSERVAENLSTAPSDVKSSFARLADAHILVLQKGNGEILMANPFSAVVTPFLVNVGNRSYYGNCIWDAMGIPAMLGADARISTSCGCCRTAMEATIKDGALAEASGVVHFAIPAARWWDDIVFN